MKNLKDLPKSDSDFWEEEAEKYFNKPVQVKLCETHRKNNWMEHMGYKDNHDGTISCQYCGWGCNLPGYLRIHEGKVFDLRQR